MGMRLVAETHARWLKTTAQAPIKMYTIVSGTDDKGSPVSGLAVLPFSTRRSPFGLRSVCDSQIRRTLMLTLWSRQTVKLRR